MRFGSARSSSRKVGWIGVALVAMSGVAASLMTSACAPTPRMGEAPTKDELAKAALPGPGESRRVGGDLRTSVTRKGETFRWGPCVIDTALPVGYPEPTPPGAIDLKTYPSVRRAVVSGKGTPNGGMNKAFWPLFNHIKEKNIAMTSPVEMDYATASAPEVSKSDWSMAFLYRTPELNGTGTDGKVEVVDAPPVTVVAVGVKGDYGTGLVAKGAVLIEAWLVENPQWEAAGNWRSLYYNGPALDFWNKWGEVQMPVRLKNP